MKYGTYTKMKNSVNPETMLKLSWGRWTRVKLDVNIRFQPISARTRKRLISVFDDLFGTQSNWELETLWGDGRNLHKSANKEGQLSDRAFQIERDVWKFLRHFSRWIGAQTFPRMKQEEMLSDKSSHHESSFA